MIDTICIDGKDFHAELNIVDGEYWTNPILDSDGEPIPKHICICSAKGEYECVCGAWYYHDYDYKSREDIV